MIKRLNTRRIRVGSVAIGGGAPVTIQSMTNTVTSDISKTVTQIHALEKAGCEIVRVAVKSKEDALAVKAIKRKITIPIVCDIHFNPLLATECISQGADKIRLNPGNIKDVKDIEVIVKAAKNKGIPIRVGVNSGSVSGISSRAGYSRGKNLAPKLVDAAIGYVRLFEKMRFRNIVVSLKGSDVHETVEAYRAFSEKCNYPLHLGITASGPYEWGIIKSSIGIGALLLDGIGDTIRVSLTADPVQEVYAAKKILSSLKLRNFGPEILSCPTCGRCQVNLIKIVNELEDAIDTEKPFSGRSSTIAVMGCEVNGPGEAREADIGVAFGKGCGVLFKKGRPIRRISSKDVVGQILKEYRKI